MIILCIIIGIICLPFLFWLLVLLGSGLIAWWVLMIDGIKHLLGIEKEKYHYDEDSFDMY